MTAVGAGDPRRGERQGEERARLAAPPPELAPGFPRSARMSAGGPRMPAVPDLDAAKQTLLAELREHSLIIGEVTLSSGAVAQYYVDARRALMRPAGFRAAGELIAAAADEVGAEAVGGPATAAIPPACAAIAVPAGRGPGRLLRPRPAQGARPAALGRGAGRGRGPLPRRRGHGHHRRLDRDGDRAGPRGGPRGRRGGRRRRPPRRRRREDRSCRRAPPTGPWSRSTRSTPTAPTAADGARRRRDPRRRLPGREAADDAGRLPALAQRSAARLQPVDQPRPGRRLRRGDGQRCASPTRPARLDPARERRRQPRPQVPPPAARGAERGRRGARAARGADAARAADAGGAEAAQRAAARLRRSRRRCRRRSSDCSSASWSSAIRGARARRRTATSRFSAARTWLQRQTRPRLRSHLLRGCSPPTTIASTVSSASCRTCGPRSRSCARRWAASRRRGGRRSAGRRESPPRPASSAGRAGCSSARPPALSGTR